LEQLLQAPLEVDPAIPELEKLHEKATLLKPSNKNLTGPWALFGDCDPSNCTCEVAPTKLILTDIQTSHLLGAKAYGFECWAERVSEEKTIWFLGTIVVSILSASYQSP
jgi:hypothetical protein